IESPISLTVTQGADASFTVTASGIPAPNYQWFYNGASLPGEINSTLTIPAAQVANAGSYKVVAANLLGSATRALATLTVLLPPFIVTQPGSLVLNPGATATFSVLAGGDPPLRYQWRFNGNPIAGATAASLTLSNVQLANSGDYDVVVANNA